MERTTHRTLKTQAEDNNSSAPPTAGHGISLPPSQAAVKKGMEDPHLCVSRRPFECLRQNPHLFGANACSLCSDIDKIRRRGRKNAAENFRKDYTYGSVIDGCISKEQKSCIWHGDSFSWEDESSGTMWVGVHGADSICVVTKSGDLDVTRLRGRLVRWSNVFFGFRKSLIAEIEDFAGRSDKLPQRFHQRVKKPFGVVSVIPDTHHAALCVENGKIMAIEFLREKMNSDTIFTVSETIQTAISAFQHLFQKKFETDGIQVSVMDPKYRVLAGGPKYKDPTVEDLNIHQIKEHLDVINN